MQIQVGNPPIDGRYVAFVRCKGHGVSEWCEPIIATFHGGRWHETREVFGWSGPIKPVTVASLTAPEYDL